MIIREALWALLSMQAPEIARRRSYPELMAVGIFPIVVTSVAGQIFRC